MSDDLEVLYEKTFVLATTPEHFAKRTFRKVPCMRCGTTKRIFGIDCIQCLGNGEMLVEVTDE